jgi:hypothetical protein
MDFEARVESWLRKSVGVNELSRRSAAQKKNIREGLCRCFDNFQSFDLYEVMIRAKLTEILANTPL